MKSSDWLILPFLIQGAAMFVDEFYFHRRRGLPTWERLGHPIDTLSVLACFYVAMLPSPFTENWGIFVALAIFSCLLVTKDEFVHSRECSAGENWLHSLLFVLHPIVLGVLAWISWHHSADPEPNLFLWTGVRIQFALTGLFGVYQIVYWNGFRRGRY